MNIDFYPCTGSDNELSPWILEGNDITWTTDRIQKVDFNVPTSDRISKKVKNKIHSPIHSPNLFLGNFPSSNFSNF